MSLQRSAFSRFRPRALTLAVALISAALIALANLSHEVSRRRLVAETWLPNLKFDLREPEDGDAFPLASTNASCGWPMLWRQSVGAEYIGAAGQCYSPTRLAANAAMWLIMLAAAAGACEWLVRRYRPRLRWNLRTMLAGIGLIAAGCGWFASARDRANRQDPLLEQIGNFFVNGVLMERWGPRWFDVIGVDRYCRRVVGVTARAAYFPPSSQTRHDTWLRLKRLPDLQYLFCQMDSDLPDALVELRRLKFLDVSLGVEYGDQTKQKCLAAIGEMAQLEHLSFEGINLDGASLAQLVGLKNLKTLSLVSVSCDGKEAGSGAPMLSYLPALPRLEAVDFELSDIGDGDLVYLAKLPNLKSLNLKWTDVTAAGLQQLPSLESLEELAVASDALTAEGLMALSALKCLRELHLGDIDCGPRAVVVEADDGAEFEVPEGELEAYRRALAALRRSHARIVVDGYDLPGLRSMTKVFSQFPRRWTGDAPRDGFFDCWHWRKEQR